VVTQSYYSTASYIFNSIQSNKYLLDVFHVLYYTRHFEDDKRRPVAATQRKTQDLTLFLGPLWLGRQLQCPLPWQNTNPARSTKTNEPLH